MRIFLAVLMAAFVAACSNSSPWGAKVAPVSEAELIAAAPTGRLSGVARPLAYRVALDLDPRQPRFSGTVQMDVKLEASATGIWLHGDDLEVSAVRATSFGETVDASWTEVLETGVVWVGFPQRLKAGGVVLEVDYSAPFDANLSGLFKVDEQGNSYALAKSESIQARRFLPSFDEPGFKAPFDMTFTIPEGMHAIANTPELSRTPARPGYESVTFATTRPLSTYLLSVAVGNFDKVVRADIPPNAIRTEPIPLTGYARAGKGAELDYILSITPDFVAIFEEALQQPYPYAKLDIVAAPQWPSGATELAGAITYRESRILRGPSAGPGFVRSLKEIHGHEVAHMWFGNLVTPPWWNDLWLKEGFATWGEPMVLSEFEPDAGHDVTAVAEALSAMKLDSLASARAVSEPIDRNENIRNAYDAITYRKGLAIINMADRYFGPEVFRPALGEYVAAFADKDADSADFFEIIGKVTGEPLLTEAFQSFVTQNGVPLIETELQCGENNAKVTLSQSRYRPLGSDIDPDRRWTIPICVSWIEGDQTGKNCTMMRGKMAAIALDGASCPQAYVPNADGAGYYRFAMSDADWEGVGAAFPSLAAGEALVTLDSARASFEAGRLSAKAYVNILNAGAGHDDNRVLGMMLNDYSELLERLEGRPAQARARAAVGVLIDDLRARLGTLEADDELGARLDRFEARDLRSPERRNQLVRAVTAFMADPASEAAKTLSSDQYVSALSVALEDGGADMFDTVLAARSAIDDPVFEQAVVSALSRVTGDAGSARVRALVRESDFGPREIYSLAAGQMSGRETREAMWSDLQQNFPAFLNAIPTQSRRATPRLASSFCDTGRIAEVEELFKTHGAQAEGYQRALAETTESISLCAALRAATQADLEAAF